MTEHRARSATLHGRYVEGERALAYVTHKAGKLICYYCYIFDEKEMLAFCTMHDQRGCKHVCFEHAKWRLAKNWVHGHSSDCPFATPTPTKAT